MTEPGDDTGDDLSIPVLTDEHVRTAPPVAERDHELLRMPKSQNEMAAFPVEGIDRFMASGLQPHRPRNPAHERRRHGRQHGQLQPPLASPYDVRHGSLPEIAWHAGAGTGRLF